MIHVRNLSRTYQVLKPGQGILGSVRALFSREGREVRAVDNVSFSIRPGEFVGYVGPNGAGKSSTLKMLTGILMPTSGEVRVCGFTPHKHRQDLAQNIGVVFGQRTQLWWDLSASEGFDLLRKIYDIESKAFHRRLGELQERLDLNAFMDAPVRKLSLGQKMRCELAAALLHAPKILFLDEPTIGLDVVVKEELHTFLRALNADHNMTVLLTSHDLDDIERLCQRVMVIDEGQLLHDGDLPSLHSCYGNLRRLTLHLLNPPRDSIVLPRGAQVESHKGQMFTVVFDDQELKAPDLVHHLLQTYEVADLTVQEAKIEDVIKRIYRG